MTRMLKNKEALMNVIKATTPTFKYVFKTVDVADITKAFLTISKNGVTALEKSLAEASVGEDFIAWTLTQNETLSVPAGLVTSECNWLTIGGTRGSSGKATLTFERNSKEVVI